ncbi:hypothetical protein QVN24_15035 [Yersinia ruckeri]|uniref:hypothetical protein n=1 Tax=Yersinia ruckeri TaxID=29486 RepID=UPI000A51BB94|nr:hypothetical protein [Yersinia ruckeri]MCK8543033.1 hypothetical protein [Yersinia ruckeri]MCK8552329.1 hypothetical protein [Yersinia ruckeri]MCW6520106.1 hypothetical protein [Yersinia ruckeri]MCW6524777.1 hypothetical protein [Yersinia ruckeri]MCW6578369.1 hypothetical protein [Yersinia ruckeri]
MINTITIDSIDSLESVFGRIQSGEEILIEQLKIELFDSVKFKIYGDPLRYNGTLPASLAQGLCEFQTEMYKVYTLIRYKTDNLQRLGSGDREDAEIVFSINPGCTEIITALTDLATACGNAFDKVTHGMSPTQKTTCFLFAIALFGGAWVGTSYLNSETEVAVKQEETKQQENKIKSENEKLTILKDGMLQSMRANAGVDTIERAEGIQEHVTKAYTGVLKAASDADRIEIEGAAKVNLSQKDVHELIRNPIEKAKKEERNLELVIDSIKRTSEKLTLSCREPSSEESFPVSVDTSFIVDKDEISLLFDAMKENKSVKILGSYTIRAGVIENGNASTISKP